jgi:UDP-N-acetylmuramoylalanine--D-glutamate ligase
VTLPVSREGWDGVRVVVRGFGPEGQAAADNLLFLGAEVTVLDEEPATAGTPRAERAELLQVLGAEILLGPGRSAQLPDACDLLITTPYDEDGGTLEEQADVRSLPVWSDAELAWRLREEAAPPWLVVGRPIGHAVDIAGMVAAICAEAGRRAVVVNDLSERPLVEVVMDPDQPDVVVVELSGEELLRTSSVRPESAVVVSSVDPAQARAYDGVRLACLYNVADPGTEQFVVDAEVEEGARAVGLALDTPGVSMLGLVEDILVDRAFIAERQTSAAELATLADLGPQAVDNPSYVLGALAAAGLARAHGVSQAAVRDGLRAYGAGRIRP